MAIVKGTHEAVRKKGYQQMTVADICQEAGIVRATFYVYFANKQDAFVAMMRELLEGVYALAGQRFPDSDEYSRIVKANAAYFRAWYQERQVLSEWFALALIDEDVAAIYRHYRDMFEERVEQRVRYLCENGRIPPCDPRLATVAITGMVETFTRRLCTAEADLGVPEEVFPKALETVSDCWYRSLYGRVAPAHDYSQYRLEERSSAAEAGK
jgi:AcrR family transcriptional regulator